MKFLRDCDQNFGKTAVRVSFASSTLSFRQIDLEFVGLLVVVLKLLGADNYWYHKQLPIAEMVWTSVPS